MSADYAAIAEPKGLFNMDSKIPDGMTTFPYKEGKPLAWDFTCVDTVADSYSDAALTPQSNRWR